MPLEVLAEISATVTSAEPVRTFDAYVEDESDARTFQPALSTLYRDAFDSFDTYHGYRVVLDGRNVAPWIVGGVEHRQNGYSGEEELRFSVTGRQWSIWTTELTSTMLAPVVLEVEHGRNPAEMVADAPISFRIVGAEQRQADGHHVLVEITCLDELSARARTAELCFAVEPLSGLTVGSILGTMCDGVPIAHEIPDGRTFLGRIQETGTEFLSRFRELAETEGWHPRTRDRVVRMATMELRPPDEPADWELNPSKWNAGSFLDASAPQEVPYRYVLRGETSVVSDDGVEIVREVLEERGLFAPEYALVKQVGGVDSPATVSTGINPPVATDSLISRLSTERQIRNGRPEIETVTEQGWGWTERSLALFDPSGNKLVYTGGVYVDDAGLGRTTVSQRFKVLRKTTTRWTYGANGEETKRVVSVVEDVKRDKPFANPNNPDNYLLTAYLYGDGRSYADPIAREDILSEEITYRSTYGTSGRKTAETALRFAYYLRAARSSGAVNSTSPPVMLNADGNGQVQGIASFQKTHNSRTSYLGTTASGQRLAEVTDQSGWRVRPRQTGEYEINGEKTDDPYELYGKLSQERETSSFRRITKNQTSVNTWKPGELPKTVTVLAPLPINPGAPSSWTSTRTQPLELFEEDPALLERYGAIVRVISSDFADSMDVLRRLFAQARRRDNAVVSTIERRLSPIETGDTVELGDYSAGMNEPRRGLCTEKLRVYTASGDFVERLDFEVERSPS